jgi:NAD(P)-dependent dehydrogenase (short-subunit alcohol dehydrogenase family)
MITENGGDAIFVQVDVTSASAVEALISKTVETYVWIVPIIMRGFLGAGLRERTGHSLPIIPKNAGIRSSRST